MAESGKPETIQSTEVIPRGKVSAVETRGDYLRIAVSASISAAALLIGVGFLATAIYLGDAELKTWATGLISLVVGTAIGFAFSGTSGGN